MFELIKLPFAEDALAPHMSAETLKTHHGKHHAAYVKKTNALLIERGKHPTSLEDVVAQAAKDNDKPLFNQSAQVWNHGFFWQSLTPQAQGAPQGALAQAVEKKFGSAKGFRDEFIKRGETHFASGWVWLLADKNGEVSIADLHDADTPIAHGQTPILTCDVWEHAYYLDYKNERPRFLNAFFDNLANWEFAGQQYEAAAAGHTTWRYPAPSAEWAQAS